MARTSTNERRSDLIPQLRNFLMRTPRPVAVKVLGENGEETDYQIAEGENFMHLAEKLDALDPKKVTVYDDAGTPQRVWRAAEMLAPSAGLEIPSSIAGDGNAAMLMHFANLIHRSYEHATDVAFDRLANLVDRVMEDARDRNERLKTLEDMYFTAMHANVELAANAQGESAGEAAGEMDEDSFKKQMFSTFMQGANRARRQRKQTVEAPPDPEEETE